jgi:hypothetical protein
VNIRNRRWLILGLAFIASALLLAYWLTRPDIIVEAPPSVAATDAPVNTPATPQEPATSDTSTSAATPPAEKTPTFATFRGRVIDAVSRKPVREFEVQFHGAQQTKVGEEAPGSRTFKTTDGRFEWDYLPAGVWTVTASAGGYQRFELNGLALSKGATTREVVLPMRRGHTLRGRVYDEDSGAGIAAASIGFREASTGRFEGNFRMRVHVQSAKDGTFALDGVPTGRMTLDVYAQDHGGRELEVMVNDATGPVEIALSAGGTISGRLAAADGVTPIAGAIGLFNMDEGHGGTSRSGPAGEFSFEHLAPGRYQLTGHAQDGNVSREIVLAKNQRVEDIVLALHVGRTIRGVVRGVSPEDLKHLAISLRTDDATGSPYSEVRVDDRGAYALRGVKPGRVQVVAEVMMRRQLVRTVDVPTDTDVTVDFDFPAGARLSGRVTHGGQPVARVRISPRPAVEQPIYNYGASTSSDGTYVIEHLANGEYVLFVGDFKSKPVQVSGDTVFDIDVPLAQLSGRIVEGGGKVPVVDANVEIWPTEPDPARARRWDRSNHFGQFGLAGLEPGQYLLTAYKPGYEMYRRQIAYEKPVADMTIRLQPDPGVEIRVRQADNGKPIDQVYVYELMGERNGMQLVVPLNEEGEGYIPAGLEGSRLSFVASGFAQAIVESWSGQQLDLKLTRERPEG